MLGLQRAALNFAACGEIWFDLFFLPTCAGEKTLLSAQVCERSECAAVRCKKFFQKAMPFGRKKKHRT